MGEILDIHFCLFWGWKGPNGYTETDTVKVSCTGVGATGSCNQWSIVSVSRPGGSMARLVQLTTGKKPVEVNLGDFLFSFSISVTNP